MQSAYKAELYKLVREGIITEVHEHTEWINFIVPVMKEEWQSETVPGPKRLEQSNQKKPVVCKNSR